MPNSLQVWPLWFLICVIWALRAGTSWHYPPFDTQDSSWGLSVLSTGSIENPHRKNLCLLTLFQLTSGGLKQCQIIYNKIHSWAWNNFPGFSLAPMSCTWFQIPSSNKIFEISVSYLAIKDVFEFPLFFSVDLKMLGFWLFSFHDWVWVCLRSTETWNTWLTTFMERFRVSVYADINRNWKIGKSTSNSGFLLSHIFKIFRLFSHDYLPMF